VNSNHELEDILFKRKELFVRVLEKEKNPKKSSLYSSFALLSVSFILLFIKNGFFGAINKWFSFSINKYLIVFKILLLYYYYYYFIN